MPESSRSRRSEAIPSPARSALQKAAAAICFLLIAGTGQASPSSAFRDYQSGDYKSAFDEYNRLAQQNTNDYRLHYDAGAAAYRAKQLEKAEKQFNAALSSPAVTADLLTQEHTYYDLGNTEYRLGESLSEPDKKEERWQRALDSYTNALRLNTNDLDAKNNLAYVKQKLEELKQQQQKQNKDQKDQKNDKDQQNQDQKDQKQQQQQDSAKQDQKNGQDKKSAQDKKKEEEKKRQQEQAKKDQEKKEQQQQAQAKQGEQKDKSPEEAQQAAAAGQMTPEEARQLLSEQKDEEKALIFAPENQPVKTQSGKIKDW